MEIMIDEIYMEGVTLGKGRSVRPQMVLGKGGGVGSVDGGREG